MFPHKVGVSATPSWCAEGAPLGGLGGDCWKVRSL